MTKMYIVSILKVLSFSCVGLGGILLVCMFVRPLPIDSRQDAYAISQSALSDLSYAEDKCLRVTNTASSDQKDDLALVIDTLKRAKVSLKSSGGMLRAEPIKYPNHLLCASTFLNLAFVLWWLNLIYRGRDQ